ncbi:DUF5704 domain-containing protein [Cytobacillus praedii]|uniref:DUF5704 domain-containing protein n=1 Tax=Cytobacillus praedii TaxID=1742358 RepID=UPI002E229A5B|nr:DUF5704 domain-containing protein [Cytobacillus praedii]
MIRVKKIFLLLLVLLLAPIVPSPNSLEAEAAPVENTLSGPESEFHRREPYQNLWDSALSNDSKGLDRWLLKSVNVNRLAWHQWHIQNGYSDWQIKVGYESSTAYTPPAGWEIQGILKYPVYRPRHYPVSIRDCSLQTNGSISPSIPPNQGSCHPHTYQPDEGDNRWVFSISKSHWRYDREEATWEGKRGPFYIFDAAQKNGYAYDFRIKPKGGTTPTDPCKTNPNAPGCGGGGDPGTEEPNDPGPPPVTPPPTESCPVDKNVSNSGSMGSNPNNMLADPNGKIIESAESSQFNVLKYGIPSSEYLKVEGYSEKYLSDYNYQGKNGQVTYRVKVTKDYMLRWQEGKEIKYEHVRREEYVPDSYSISYWQIGHLAIYSFQDAIFRNYGLPNEMVIVPNFQRVSASSNHNASIDAHVFPQPCQSVYQGLKTIEGGQSKPSAPYPDFSGAAGVGSRPPQVKNDSVNVDGFTSMSDAMATQHAPTPSPIPIAPQVKVEQSSLQIDPLKVNKWQTPSSITARYETIHTVNTGSGSREFTGNSPTKINTVTVHTPVVMYARASDDKEHDQRTDPPDRSTPPNPDKDRHAFILDRPFSVTLPTKGQHLDIGMAPGYGNRDYAKYTRQKQVKFPFDVYSETKQAFYSKETWINVPVDMETANFFMPVWVPEGQYTIKFRSIAINAPADLPEEHHANLNMTYRTPNEIMANHVAFDTIEVDVVGRLYDFRVTDVLDFNWGPVFRKMEGLVEHTGNYYWVGDKGIDGAPRGNKEPFVLPIRQGSHPEGYKNVAVKTGYQFKFDMKTKGDMWRENDAIRITPSFYFVDKTGQNRRKVDVYYHNDSKYFVKIGSEQDKEYREVTLNEPLRNVPESQLLNTSDYYFRHPDRYGFRSIVDQSFAPGFDRYFQRDFAKRGVETGPYGWQILSWKLRSFIGPLANTVPSNAMKPQKDAIASEQMWYGEYSLPADIYIVEEGKNIAGYGLQHRLNKSHPIFLRDGYLIVNFNIESVQNGKVDQPHLQYIFGELSNQWKREGFKYNFVDPYGYTFPIIDGDVIFYHGDQSSTDDFKPGVTH